MERFEVGDIVRIKITEDSAAGKAELNETIAVIYKIETGAYYRDYDTRLLLATAGDKQLNEKNSRIQKYMWCKNELEVVVPCLSIE